MKTVQYMIDNYTFECFDGRDAQRFSDYVEEKDLEKIGLKMSEGCEGSHETKPYTRESVLENLKRDVLFGWEKCQNQRGLSAGLMYSVVRMWNTILEEGLEDFDDYGEYGQPLFEKTAEKYGWTDELD